MESQDQKRVYSHLVKALHYIGKDTEAQGGEVICPRSQWGKDAVERKKVGRERAGMKKQDGKVVVCDLWLPKNRKVFLKEQTC